MEDALLKLVVTVPSAAAVIFVVVLFLRSQDRTRKDHNGVIERMSKNAIKCQEDCDEAVKETNRVVTENTKVLTRLTTLIETRIRQSGGET
jgi:hypothetical protein